MSLQQDYKTPHLTTASTAPLHLLEKQLLAQQTHIENWFESQWKLTPAPVYGSVDLRNAGAKLAPIDMNLFPAGLLFLVTCLKQVDKKLNQCSDHGDKIRGVSKRKQRVCPCPERKMESLQGRVTIDRYF